MNISKVSGIDFGRRKHRGTYAETQPYKNGDDTGMLTKYLNKSGELIGYRRVHDNGLIERAYQYPDGTLLITRKFNRHQPAFVKGFDSKGNFHPEVPVVNILGHNPNRRIIEEKWAEENLFNING